MKKKAVFNWSGGKDSALALQMILENDEFDVISLLTTVDGDTKASSIHSIPKQFLIEQAESLGIPLHTVSLFKEPQSYEKGMTAAIEHFKKLGVRHFIFGDIFLEDVKTFREGKLNPLGIEVVLPLWGKTSKEVMIDFIQSGIKTKIILTQADKLDHTYIGKELDADFPKSLPEGIDLCGENGEYHTFVYDGKFFKSKIDFRISEVKKITHEFKMDTGEVKKFEYWQAIIGE